MPNRFFVAFFCLFVTSGSIGAQQTDSFLIPENRAVVGTSVKPLAYWESVSLQRCSNPAGAVRCMYQNERNTDLIGESLGARVNGFGWFKSFDRVQVGNFKENFLDGLGIEYNLSGAPIRSGRWVKDRLVESITLDPYEFPYDLELKSNNSFLTFLQKSRTYKEDYSYAWINFSF
jgi:hypothetical protein